MTTFR